MRCLILIVFVFSQTIALAQGHLWGVTNEGGSSGAGVVYKTKADGTGYTVVKDFEVQYGGASPWYTQLTEADNGKLYGMTLRGGAGRVGVLFEFDPATGSYVKKVDFDGVANGAKPYGSLIKAANGKLYGLTSAGGTEGYGVLFEFDPATGNFQKKLDMNFSDGIVSHGSLVQTADGKFYALMKAGGSANLGTLIEYDLSTNTLVKKVDFAAFGNAAGPEGFLTLAPNGKLYSFSLGGWIYEFNPANGEFLMKRQMPNAYVPYGAMVAANNGKLYGTSSDGGAFSDVLNDNEYGTLYEYDPESNAFEIKVNFGFYQTGSDPYGSLILGANGKLYGTTTSGGLGGPDQDQIGVIFEYEIDHELSLLHPFQLETGGFPYGGLTQHSNGKFYGMTMLGGISGEGVLYEFDPVSQQYSKKLDFGFAPDGAMPSNKLTLGSDGNIYGVTSQGGAFGGGVVFEIDTLTGAFTNRYNFSFADDGIAVPDGGLTEASNNKMYGIVRAADNNFPGAVLEFDPVTGEIDQFRFAVSGQQGNGPLGGLLLATNGKLYGTAVLGDINNDAGTLFEFDPITKTITKKADFERTTKGAYPNGDLIEVDGKLYGTTLEGGVDNRGVIFQYTLPSGPLTKLFDFHAHSSPGNYVGSPGNVVCVNGNLYGLTRNGSELREGMIYEFSTVTNAILRTFELSSATGNLPFMNDLMLSPVNQRLYGTTAAGGDYNHGTLFEFDPVAFSFTKTYDFNDASGEWPTGALMFAAAPVIMDVEELLHKNRLQVYPNPATEYVSIAEMEYRTVRQSVVIDLTGRIHSVQALSQNDRCVFPVSQLPTGCYVLQVVTGNGTYRAKFFKN